MGQVSVGQQPFEFSISGIVDAGTAQRGPGAAAAHPCHGTLRSRVGIASCLQQARPRHPPEDSSEHARPPYSFQPASIDGHQERGQGKCAE
ncbi:MAG: hypothetical protein QOJ51_4803 [Acidobacteriaceae bacterium]|nr:hypothetical protein [Acidobacteriaceae bacterium]MEA2261978.1 hypothetical protein [Acidobacteriaceae bacterium]